jgi:hypothetical protein
MIVCSTCSRSARSSASILLMSIVGMIAQFWRLRPSRVLATALGSTFSVGSGGFLALGTAVLSSGLTALPR